ncbi:hypothetical protein [Scytonema millei]|uniref:hypothetical protein n=1 Tax=Scytonema millei TaxID=1245922 RepID=UPI0010FACA5F
MPVSMQTATALPPQKICAIAYNTVRHLKPFDLQHLSGKRSTQVEVNGISKSIGILHVGEVAPQNLHPYNNLYL